MNLKHRIIQALIQHPDGLSCADLATLLGSTKNAIKVTICHMRRDGEPIEGGRVDGYKSGPDRRVAERYVWREEP